MKTNLLVVLMLNAALFSYSQAGHILQGAGSVNWSMGGASTAQPIDIMGAMQWNPAAISAFDEKIARFDIGFFSSSPRLFSTVPEIGGTGLPTGNFISGRTLDDRPTVPLPSLGMLWGKEGNPHTFGFSFIGISGAGVTFPENMENPLNLPQAMGGLGRIESDYGVLQVGFAYSYQISPKFSIGVQPSFNRATLELIPNPTAPPTLLGGYGASDKSSAIGFGAQFGLFFDSNTGFKAGASYKTKINFQAFELENTYLDGTQDTNEFEIDYPSILSLGVGFSNSYFDLALDYRYVFMENADGLSSVGWTPAATVLGFGWKDISIVSVGIQYKGITKVPLRVGYTYSDNPVEDEVAFFNVSSVAIIRNAWQLGLSYIISPRVTLDAVFHYGISGEATRGPIYSPLLAGTSPPYGPVPGSEVSFDMTTAMGMIGLNYTFKRRTKSPD